MLESYRDLTDEQLIAALKNSGDPDGKIMDYILDKYKPLVRKKANAVFLIGGETDDLIQEGYERNIFFSFRRIVYYETVIQGS